MAVAETGFSLTAEFGNFLIIAEKIAETERHRLGVLSSARLLIMANMPELKSGLWTVFRNSWMFWRGSRALIKELFSLWQLV